MSRFGPFEADFPQGELYKGGTRIKIQEQPLRVLEALLQRPGELVTREELQERLWAADTYVDFERSLNAAVAKLRQSLNDSADHPLYIETVAKRGYRFIAPVTLAEATMTGAPVVPPPVTGGARWVGGFPVAAAGFLAVVGVIGAWWYWSANRGELDRPLVRLDLDIEDEVTQPVISRDGIRIVFVKNGRLATRQLDNLTITTLAGTDGASHPFLSPDGKWVGFFAERRLKKVAVEGGEPATLCYAPFGGGGAWGEDGYIIAALSTSGGLSRIPASGGAPQSFTKVEGETGGVTNHRSPQMLPGGKGLLYVAGIGNAEGQLRAISSEGAKPKMLVGGSQGGRYVPTGHLVYFMNGSLFGAPMDLDSLEIGPAFPLIQKVAQDFFRGGDFDVSSTGTLVYRSAKPPLRVLAWLDAEGRKEELDLKPDGYFTPRISPDGKYLALLTVSEGQASVWGYEIAQRTLMRLTFDNEPKCCPLWTPDGRYITYTSGSALKVIPRDGSKKPEQLLSGANPAAWSYSPKGDWLTFHRTDPKTASDAWIAPVVWRSDGPRLGEAKPLVKLPGIQSVPSISPDGRWLMYGSDESGRVELYVTPFLPNGKVGDVKWQVSTGAFYGSPTWSRNGREILYRGRDLRIRSVSYRANGHAFVAETPRLWSNQPLADVGIFPGFDATADGKRVIAVVDTEESRRNETHLRVVLHLGDELRRASAGRRSRNN